MAVCILLVLYYALSSVHSQYYSLSIFQALGYRKKELSLAYLLETVLFTLITAGLFFASYQIFYRNINMLLVKAIFVLDEEVVYLNILTFSRWYYFIIILSLFAVTVLVILVYLYLVLHRRSVHQLQNEE